MYFMCPRPVISALRHTEYHGLRAILRRYPHYRDYDLAHQIPKTPLPPTTTTGYTNR